MACFSRRRQGRITPGEPGPYPFSKNPGDLSPPLAGRDDRTIVTSSFSLQPKEKTAMAPSHAQYPRTVSLKLQGWRRRQARRRPEPWLEAALVLLRLDLDPARPLRRTLYAPGPRGRPPSDPVCVLRALLLLLLLHYNSLPQWAHDRRTHPR